MEDKLAALPFMLLSVSQIIIFFILDFQIDRIKRKLEKGEAPYWKERLRAHDTISRQEAIDAFWKLDIELRPSAIDAITDMFKELPSAQPDCSDCIKHGGDWDCDHVHCHKGKWIVDDVATEHCSVCKHRFYISALFAVGGNDEPPCCPNCGADMRGEQDE